VSDNIIEAKALSKTFGSFTAVTDLSFSIQQGDVYGFLGQNGAGKSTTIRMLLGLIYPDAGEVYIKGQLFNNRSRHLLQHIGAIIERPDMYLYLSGWDNLKMFARLSGKPIKDQRLHEVLEIVGLKGREQDKVKAYSQGMKQRLGIAIALVHNPDLLILDEPTNGLDPQGIAEMRLLIQSLSRDHGKTILISSHLLYEIEQIATRMIILHRGRKVVEGAVRQLLDPAETLMEVDILPDESIGIQLNSSEWNRHIHETSAAKLVFKMHPSQMPALNNWLVAQGAQVLQIRSSHSLEAYFLSLTNEADVKAGTV
jgi:ABC-type multidrug transport system ATPase subunit